jgi:hypothetical protein
MAVAAGRLDTALIQEDCTPVGGDRRLWKDAVGDYHRLWKDAVDWWRICG